jgi:ketosteroid isomerase-like protein
MTDTQAETYAVEQVVEELVAALNRRDREGARACFTSDAVYSPSVAGADYSGADAAVDGLFRLFDAFRSGEFAEIRRLVDGDGVFVEWRFAGETNDGEELVIHGCDFFLVRDGAIAIKNAFRKVA